MAAVTAPPPAASAARPLVIDCDPGIDDALALMLAVASPEFDLLGVTCVAGNRPVEVTADNACRVLDAAGRHDIPVHAGCDRTLAGAAARANLVHREDGLGGVALPRARAPLPLHAADFLARVLDGPSGRVTLVALGPLTNLALAQTRHPGLLRRASEVLVMGGAAFCPGNVTPLAEFNFHADAAAADIVLGSGANVRVFGLDVTRQLEAPAHWITALSTLGNRCGRLAAEMLHGLDRPRVLLHDVCPVACLLAPGHFVLEPCLVAVDSHPGPGEGQLRAARLPAQGLQDGSPAAVCTGADAPAVLGLLRERLARLP